HVWPVRNTLLFHLDGWWQSQFGSSAPAGPGAIAGCVRSEQGGPLAGATVLVSEPDGALHQAATAGDGCYRLDDLPAGRYVPWISAAGYADAVVAPWGLPLSLGAGATERADLVLYPDTAAPFDPISSFSLGAPLTLTVDVPSPAAAVRRQLWVASAAGPNQPTFVYAPVTATAALPTLLAIYPGTAEEWEGVSVPLAAAGYAVVAVGPEYSLDLESDIAELKRLVGLVRGGGIPGADGGRLAVMGGSYSSLHVQRLLREDTGFRGAVLLGPISDLFDMRRRFAAGTFMPPFGLDKALIALGWPHTAIERYATYSSLYGVRADLPPVLLMHSRADEIVPAEQSERLVEAMRAKGVSAEAHFFDGMSHYLRTDQPSADLDALYATTLDFLGRELR
ncbi:MAG TPA: carboxypeptidase regulatory-like domain-containing protein, partial [Herpetosiphonaceae bacterium]|nr:carboxypeptidase regulatory-like domain-containing protein [Herpetosiphonaceae bacterium]